MGRHRKGISGSTGSTASNGANVSRWRPSEFTAGAPIGLMARITPSRFRARAVFQKSKGMPVWRIAGRVNEVNGINEVPFGSRPSLSDGSTKWSRPAGVLDKVDKIDKVDPEIWT